MKMTILIAALALVSAVVVARDLSSLARKERARRQTSNAAVRTFTNADLDAYAENELDVPPKKTSRQAPAFRDLAKEEAFWRRETAKHQRELARLDAGIRRLEWRLRERETRFRANGRAREDPAITMIEQSLQSLREERDEVVTAFHERARKAGAFPGWLR